MAIDASDVIVFKSIRCRVSTLYDIYVCVFICIHFQQRFQIDAFSVNTLSVFERISVDGRPKRIEMYAFSNEKKQLIPFIFKSAASRQEFDRSCLNISWIYEAYQISEPLIVPKHKPYSLWE